MLHEKYRPQAWGDVLGQPAAVTLLQRFASGDSWGGRAIWISGKSGTGKTTLARIYAGERADKWNTVEVDASDVTASFLRDFEECWHLSVLTSTGKTGKAYIVNEAHGLSAGSIRKLLVLLEKIPAHVVVLFTTTNDGQDLFEESRVDAHPLLSRCNVVGLTGAGLSRAFAVRAAEIAREIGAELPAHYKHQHTVADYIKLVEDCKDNFRMVLSRIEDGVMAQA